MLPLALTTADLNEDGQLDVVFTDGISGRVKVVLGDGKGGGGAVRDFVNSPVPGVIALGLTWGDFDGDRRLDLVTANWTAGSLAWLRNVSGPPVHVIDLAPGQRRDGVDFGNGVDEGQGGVELSAAIAGKVFRDLNGDGVPSAGEPGLAGITVFLDANQNGVRDPGELGQIAVADDPSTPSRDETGEYHFANLPPGAYAVVEEVPPNLVQAAPRAVQFQDTAQPTGAGPRALAAGDLDGDGKVDLAVANEITNDITVLRNLGNGNFAADARQVPVGFGPSGVALGDWDGDGRRDLATANNYTGRVTILHQNADGTFATAAEVAAGAGPSALVAVDLDGDGDLDLAVTNEFNNNVTLLRNSGGVFSPAGALLVGNTPECVTAADVNRDGRPDLIVANFSSRNVSLLRNTGNFTFAAAVNMATGTHPFAVTAADVNGDGYPDLISANVSADDVSVLKNRGDGTFFPAVDFAAGVGPTSVVAADLDRDGDLDLAVGNATSQQLSVLLNDGSGEFGAPLQFGAANFPVALPYALTAADFNGDGHADLALTNGQTDSVSVLLADARPGPYRVNLARNQTLSGLNFGNQLPNAAPTSIQLSNSALPENSAGASVGTITVVDPDPADTHMLTVIDNRFEVLGQQLKLKTGQSLSRQQGTTISLDVTATDSAQPPLSVTRTFVLTVTANPRPWQNPQRACDVDHDGTVAPLDALILIAELNRGTIRQPDGSLPTARAADAQTPFWDPTGDGLLQPIDVLLVVAYINAPPKTAAAEGEAVGRAPASASVTAATDKVFAAVWASPRVVTEAFRQLPEALVSATAPATAATMRVDRLAARAAFARHDQRWFEEGDEVLDDLAADVAQGWTARS